MKYESNTKKFNFKVALVWGALIFLYIAFIAVFSYLYPYTKDEILLYKVTTLPRAWKAYLLAYNGMNPRIGQLAAGIILVYGKAFFIFINPLIQLGIITSVFYFIFNRLPSLKSLKDFPTALMLTLMCTFMIAKPDNTLFWTGGAANYSWPFLIYMFFLIYLKKEFLGQFKKTPIWVLSLLLIMGFIVGMMSENNSPMALCLLIAFAIYAHFKKIKLTSRFWLVLTGVMVGLFLYFTASGVHARISIPEHQEVMSQPFYVKVLLHSFRMQGLFCAQLFIQLITFIILIKRAVTLKMSFFKNDNLILSTLCFLTATVLAAVLGLAPLLPDRAFYSASVIYICAFMFALNDVKQFCSFDIFKTLAFFLFVWFALLFPIFLNSYLFLYNTYKARDAYIARARAQGKDTIYLEMVYNLRTFPDNLATLHYDPIGYYHVYEKYLGLKIDSDIPLKDRRN